MLTSRMLGLLQHRLAAHAPQRAGSHEYIAGVDDAIAAVRRLVEVSSPGSSTTTWLPEEPRRTRLAAEYLRLEMHSLIWMIDSLLQQAGPRELGHGEVPTSWLQEARAHLVQAAAALQQTQDAETDRG